jgi:type I restriction enzyme M protein
MSNNEIVQKLWNLCDVLRDDGINYADYVTELVLLLFIKMEHENTQSGVISGHKLPEGARWPDIARLDGPNLLTYYKATLLGLSQSTDPLISAIYADAQTRIKEPRHLKQLISAIDSIDWYSAPSATASATSTKACSRRTPPKPSRGAGQYFTPRPLDRQHRRPHQARKPAKPCRTRPPAPAAS